MAVAAPAALFVVAVVLDDDVGLLDHDVALRVLGYVDLFDDDLVAILLIVHCCLPGCFLGANLVAASRLGNAPARGKRGLAPPQA